LALAAAFVVGGAADLLLRPSFLLDNRAVASSASGIPKKATAAEQYLYAREADPVVAEAAWKSVAKYFPNDDEYTPLANQQLARYYLQHDRLDDALKMFEEFSDYDDVETQYRAFGLAGACVVYFIEARQEKDPGKHAALLEKSSNSEKELSELAGGLGPDKLAEVIKDRQMVQAIGNVLVLQKDRKSESDVWSKWLESHFHDEPASTTP
jgi:tetratricopeptide (TPR) repeat protein